MRQLPRGNAYTRVAHHKAHAFFLPGHGQSQPAPVGHGVQSIDAEVQQSLAHALGVHHSLRHAAGNPALYLNAALFRILPDKTHHMLHNTRDAACPGKHVTGARKPDKIHNDAVEPVHLIDHNIGRGTVFAAFGKALAEICGVALDGAEGIADLMRHPGSQIANSRQLFLAAHLALKTAHFHFGLALPLA